MSYERTQFTAHCEKYLDQFDREVGDGEMSRVVYAVLLSVTFKRIIRNFGFRAAALMLRGLYRVFYTAQQEAADQSTAALAGRGGSLSPSSLPPSGPEAGPSTPTN